LTTTSLQIWMTVEQSVLAVQQRLPHWDVQYTGYIGSVQKVHWLFLHVWPDGQLPDEQTPPQPSLAPQLLPAQLGTQTHWPFWQLRPAGQLPVAHVPPQPSPAPHAMPAQFGTHLQTLLTHAWPVGQVPFEHLPPQPSSAPQALPAQSATQRQRPA
jgi:hypothetical protein